MFSFTLYITTDCNLKCQYCYEDYHNHYQLNEKTLVDSLEFIMNYGDRGKVLIDFLGGEPLLKKNLIYQAVSYIKNNYPEREVKYYITTNCSLIANYAQTECQFRYCGTAIPFLTVRSTAR